MVPEVARIMGSTILECFKIVDRIFTELDGWDFFLVAFILVTVSRFLLVPLLRGNIGGIGALGSDMAKRGISNYLHTGGSSDNARGEK